MWLVRSDDEAGATSALPADVPAGTYAVVCFVDDVPIEQVYIAEQLDVTEQIILGQLEDPPDGLAELRAVLLSKHQWRQREGLDA